MIITGSNSRPALSSFKVVDRHTFDRVYSESEVDYEAEHDESRCCAAA